MIRSDSTPNDELYRTLTTCDECGGDGRVQAEVLAAIQSPTALEPRYVLGMVECGECHGEGVIRTCVACGELDADCRCGEDEFDAWLATQRPRVLEARGY